MVCTIYVARTVNRCSKRGLPVLEDDDDEGGALKGGFKSI